MASQRELFLNAFGFIGYAEEVARLLRQMIVLEQELAMLESPGTSNGKGHGNGNGHGRKHAGPSNGELRASIAEIRIKLADLLE